MSNKSVEKMRSGKEQFKYGRMATLLMEFESKGQKITSGKLETLSGVLNFVPEGNA